MGLSNFRHFPPPPMPLLDLVQAPLGNWAQAEIELSYLHVAFCEVLEAN